jgi:hypothetical protein
MRCGVESSGCCVLCILTERRMDPLLLFSSSPPSNVPSASKAANSSSAAAPTTTSKRPLLLPAIAQNINNRFCFHKGKKIRPEMLHAFKLKAVLREAARHHPCTWNLEIAYADGHPVGTGSRRNLRPIQASNLLHLPPLECVCVCALDFLSPPPSPLSHGPSFLFESASSEAKLTTCCSPENQEIEPYASNFREIQAGMPSQAQIDVSTRSPTAHRPFLPPGRHLVLASTLGRKPPHLALLRMVLPKGLLGHSLLQLLSAILVDLPLSRDLFLSLSTVCLSPT